MTSHCYNTSSTGTVPFPKSMRWEICAHPHLASLLGSRLQPWQRGMQTLIQPEREDKAHPGFYPTMRRSVLVPASADPFTGTLCFIQTSRQTPMGSALAHLEPFAAPRRDSKNITSNLWGHGDGALANPPLQPLTVGENRSARGVPLPHRRGRNTKTPIEEQHPPPRLQRGSGGEGALIHERLSSIPPWAECPVPPGMGDPTREGRC